MSKIYFARLRKKIITLFFFNKLLTLVFVLSNLLFYSFLILSLPYATRNAYSSFSIEAYNTRKVESAPYILGEVSSSIELDSFYNFFTEADNRLGSSVKNTTNTFFANKNNNSSLIYEGNDISFSPILYTQWDFYEYNFGIQLLSSNATKKELGNGEIYISQAIANDIISNSSDISSYDDLIDYNVTIDGANCIVVDVIDDYFDNDIEILFGKYYVIASYHSSRTIFSKTQLSYFFQLFGNEIPSCLIIKTIEETIKKIDGYATTYFNFDGSSFYIGALNELKDSMFCFFDNAKFSLIALISFFIIALFLLCCYIASALFRKMPNKLFLSTFFNFSFITTSLIYFSILLIFISIFSININGILYCFNTYEVLGISFILYLILDLFLFYNKQKYIKNGICCLLHKKKKINI